MLVPLVDMLNHQGDESLLPPSQAFAAQDNVRCVLLQLIIIHDGVVIMSILCVGNMIDTGSLGVHFCRRMGHDCAQCNSSMSRTLTEAGSKI